MKANEQGGHQEATSQNLLERERQQRAARRLCRVLGKFNSGGLNKIFAPNEDGDEVEFTSKTEIEKACYKSNCQKFQQALTLLL